LSSIANGWLAVIALIAIVIVALLLVVFVITIVTLTKVNRIGHRPVGSAAHVDSATSASMAKVLDGLKAENSSLQSLVQLEESARRSAESRAEIAETAAQSAASVTRARTGQGVEKARTKEFSQLQEKLRSAELHNMSLHQECADLRAKLAKTDKRAVANNADLTETEQLLDKASRSLVDANLERDAAQREAATLKLEFEKLKAEPAPTPKQIASSNSKAEPILK
jgi:chromosome segregation ATPase